MKQYSLDEVEDVLIGKKGTPAREEYELELQLESIGSMIKTVRKKKNMTQAELGRLVGVKKAQISRLENHTGNMTLDTVLRDFNALEAKMTLHLNVWTQQNPFLSSCSCSYFRPVTKLKYTSPPGKIALLPSKWKQSEIH